LFPLTLRKQKRINYIIYRKKRQKKKSMDTYQKELVYDINNIDMYTNSYLR